METTNRDENVRHLAQRILIERDVWREKWQHPDACVCCHTLIETSGPRQLTRGELFANVEPTKLCCATCWQNVRAFVAGAIQTEGVR